MNESRHEDRCPTCGKYASPETGYCDYDWTFSTPHFIAYCDEQCANFKRAEIGQKRVRQMEIDNGEIWDNEAAA